MKHSLWLILILLFVLPLEAQDELTPYEIALERIEEARLSGATELDLSWLDLRELPPEIGELNNLQWLNLYSNQLSSLPDEIGNLSNLQTLDLTGNQLSSLPTELWQLSNLQTLNLNHNQLGSLPHEIENLSNLQALHLGENQLSSLPEEIGSLSNLQILDLQGNQLSSLPEEIGQLSNLCILNLINNNLHYLPNSLGVLTLTTEAEYCNDLVGYAELYLDSNPLISPPQEVIDQGTPAILAYLRNQAWWHLQRMIISVASGIGFLAAVFLGLRWRYQKNHKPKKKRS